MVEYSYLSEVFPAFKGNSVPFNIYANTVKPDIANKEPVITHKNQETQVDIVQFSIDREIAVLKNLKKHQRLRNIKGEIVVDNRHRWARTSDDSRWTLLKDIQRIIKANNGINSDIMAGIDNLKITYSCDNKWIREIDMIIKGEPLPPYTG
jgi:hypothetical protein